MIKFVSPIIIEENFLLKENYQKFYINKIDKDLYNLIIICIYNYMQSLPDDGLKCFMRKTELCYDKINYISINPILKDNQLYCETKIYTTTNHLTAIDKGILKDYIEDIFSNQINTYMIINDIEYNINDEYYNKIKNSLLKQNLKYTIRLNFFNYNKFFIQEE